MTGAADAVADGALAVAGTIPHSESQCHQAREVGEQRATGLVRPGRLRPERLAPGGSLLALNARDLAGEAACHLVQW